MIGIRITIKANGGDKVDVIKRAWLYVTRKKGKSLIMMFVLLAVATSVLSGIAVKKAAKISNENSSKDLANFFNLRSQNFENRGRHLSRKDLEEVLKVKEIKSYNATISGAGGNIDGLRKVKPSKEIPYNYEGVENTFALDGNDYSESDLKFTSSMIKLVEGRHIITEDKNKVLIHKSLAELNNLKIGDKLTVKRSSIDYNVVHGKGKEEMTLEIVGVFESGSNEDSVGSSLEIIENNLLTDNKSIEEFYGFGENDKIFDKASFYADKDSDLDSVITKVKKLPLKWENFRIEKGNEVFMALSKSFEKMDSIVNMVLIGSIIISAIVLSLILTFWIQGRIHETGILLSLGVSKFKIIAQYIIEILMISVLAFSISYFSGQMISQKVGDSIIEKAANETEQSIKYGAGIPLGNDPESNMLTHTTKDIEVKISPDEMIYVWLIGSGIIIASVFISSASIIRLKPKEILSKMS
ncbi:ABC transporter permease [Clostridium sp. LP20]|uniref:ABC transporter permease n=1 Tax=Clostridium sp. LP20 TaxID=3418665 RepID=UPI003EE5EC09